MFIKDLSDLTGFGEAASKLIDAVSKAVGTLYKPRSIRNEARAEADRMREIAKADVDVKHITAQGSIDVWERAQIRIRCLEERRQNNFENITRLAVEDAGNSTSTKAFINEDWMSKFINHAQDVGSEEMQKVWARILSQEARAPGKFSSRALQTLSHVSSHEAAIFQRLCHITLDRGRILKVGKTSDFFKYGFEYSDFLALKHAGLLHVSDSLTVAFGGQPSRMNSVVLRYPLDHLIVTRSPPKKDLIFSNILLTPVGVELMALISREKKEPFVDQYLLDLKDFLSRSGFSVILSSN